MSRSSKVLYAISILLGLAIVALVLYGPILQSDAYHHFADDRTLLGHIPNSLNVLSNLAFLLPFVVMYRSSRLSSIESGAGSSRRVQISVYIFLFGSWGVAVGSSLYHGHPSNSNLVWDRLPMTICFAVIFAEFLRQYVSRAAGTVALWFLLAFGIQSVMYWQIVGDLRLYVLVQFFPIVAIPLIAAIVGTETRSFWGWLCYLFNTTESSTRFWRNTFLCYGAAKIFEAMDENIYALFAQFVSGHTLKHIASGVACTYALKAVLERRSY